MCFHLLRKNCTCILFLLAFRCTAPFACNYYILSNASYSVFDIWCLKWSVETVFSRLHTSHEEALLVISVIKPSRRYIALICISIVQSNVHKFMLTFSWVTHADLQWCLGACHWSCLLFLSPARRGRGILFAPGFCPVFGVTFSCGRKNSKTIGQFILKF